MRRSDGRMNGRAWDLLARWEEKEKGKERKVSSSLIVVEVLKFNEYLGHAKNG